MRVPVVKQGSILIAQIQTELGDRDLIALRDELAEKVGRFRSQGVVVDVTAIEVIDSFSTRMLSSIAQTMKLRGAEAVIVGVQPDVAFSMIQLGLTLDEVTTALDLEDGLAVLRAKGVFHG